MPNFGGHWTDLNQTWTHIHLWVLLKNFVETLPVHLPTRAGAKTLFGTDFESLTEHIFATKHDINNRNEIINLQGLYLHDPQVWGTFVLNFLTGRHCQPYRMDVI